MKLGGLGVFWDLSRGFRRWNTVRKILGFKEHIDWLKIDLNAAEIITVQDYKHTKKTNMDGSTHGSTVLRLRVKKVIHESKIWWQHKKAKAARWSARDLKNLRILQGNSAEGLGSRRERCWRYVVSAFENTPKPKNLAVQGRVQLGHSCHIVKVSVEAIC